MKLVLNPNLDVNDTTVVPIWEKGQHGGRTRLIDKDLMFKAMLDFVKVLDKHNVKYCISHGTMLGIYRDGNFITCDDDVDLALLDITQKELVETVCRKELEELGFWVAPKNDSTKPIKAFDPDSNMPYYDTVAIRDGEKIECWWFDRVTHGSEDFYIYDEPRAGWDLKHDAIFYDKLKDYEWKGYTWKIPNHIEDWLVMMYGTTWRTPQEGRKYNNQYKPDVYGDAE